MENTPHTHKTDDGFIVTCYHKCKSVLTEPAFWIGTMISYPFEHFLYEKVWPFSIVGHWFGI